MSDAVAAVLAGQADEAAYSVAGAAGIGFICGDAIWYRKENQVDATKARAIINQALEDGSTEGPVPDDDEKAIAKAEELVDMATQAWRANVRGPEVEAILTIVNSNGAGEDPPPVETEQPPADSQGNDSPPPTGEEPEEEQDLSKVEPWEDYGKEKVDDIIEGINAARESWEEQEVKDLLANIWAYEEAHRNRKKILAHLEAIGKEMGLGPEDEADPATAESSGAETGAGEKPDAAAPEADAGGTGEAEGGEGEGEGAASPDGGAADAESSASAEAPEAGAEGKPDKEAADGAAGPSDAGDAAGADEPGGTEDQAAATSEEYERLIEDVEDSLKRERLHIPEPPTEDAPEVPYDWTGLSNKELQALHSTFSSFAHRVNYLLAREERIASTCRAAADELHRSLLVLAEKYDDHDKQKTMTILEAEVETDPNVKAWRKRQKKHETFAASYRNERDSYNKLVEAMSRLETMRMNEWERSGQKSGRPRPK